MHEYIILTNAATQKTCNKQKRYFNPLRSHVQSSRGHGESTSQGRLLWLLRDFATHLFALTHAHKFRRLITVCIYMQRRVCMRAVRLSYNYASTCYYVDHMPLLISLVVHTSHGINTHWLNKCVHQSNHCYIVCCHGYCTKSGVGEIASEEATDSEEERGGERRREGERERGERERGEGEGKRGGERRKGERGERERGGERRKGERGRDERGGGERESMSINTYMHLICRATCIYACTCTVMYVVNPRMRRRVTVLVLCVCVSVCLCVCYDFFGYIVRFYARIQIRRGRL